MGKIDKSERYVAIDLLRCFCIISMIFSHLASQSVVTRALHPSGLFDGASGFVLLSGLILGMVQRRRIHSAGLRFAQGKLLRRIGVIYMGQVVIVFLALAITPLALHAHHNLLSASSSPPLALMQIAFLLSAPPDGNVLRLYVVLMFMALGIFALLHNGQWKLSIGLSIVLYLLASFMPALTSFYDVTGNRGWNWGAWQFLFVSALIAGWYWIPAALGQRLLLRPWLSVATCFVLFLICHVTTRDRLFLIEKQDFGPVRVIAAYAAVAAGFVLLTLLQPKIPSRFLRPLKTIGERSLDAYLIQAGAAIILPSFIAYEPRSATGFFFAILVIFVCWAFAQYRKTGLLQAIREQAQIEPTNSARQKHSDTK